MNRIIDWYRQRLHPIVTTILVAMAGYYGLTVGRTSPAPGPEPSPTPIEGIVATVSGLPVMGPVEAGKLVSVRSAVAADLEWIATVHGVVDLDKYPCSGGYSCVLAESASVDFVAVDWTGRHIWTLRVEAQSAPRPPPTPEPIPDPTPTPVTDRTLFLALVEDATHRTADTAIVLSALNVWNGFRERGHDWRFYDVATTEPRGVEARAKAGSSLPAIVVFDSSGGFVAVEPLPKEVEGLEVIVSKYSTRGGK